MSSHSHSSQRTHRSYSDLPGMGQPDDSPPRSVRGIRTSSMPLVSHPQSDLVHSQQAPQSNVTPPYSQRRSSPVALSMSQPQHVPPPNSQNFSAGHTQFHSLTDQGPEHHSQATSQHTPPLNFPRPVQRVPPPPLLGPDSRFNTIRDDWTMTDKLLAEIGRAAEGQEASLHANINIAGIGAGAGLAQYPAAPVPKGPVIERERTKERKDSPREGEVGGSGGSAGSGPGRSGSLRQSSRVQAQQQQTNNETPPRTPPHTQSGQGQPQRPLPVVPDRSQPGAPRSTEGSPTYYSPLTSPHSETAHHTQSQSQSQPRDNSPTSRYDERLQTGALPTKTKTPDRSLPVQEENEAEEDVTITPSTERERARERERIRDRELDMETLKERPRAINHRLPTPQFSSSPMIPPNRMKVNESSSEVELSTTVQGDDYHDHAVYDNEHDGRNSRAGHRFDDEGGRPQDDNEAPPHVGRRAAQQEAEDQDETESYTPRSNHASLPQSAGNNGGQNTERVVYGNAQLHFRPRTASSDAGGMANLDTAMLHDAIEKLQQPYFPEQNHILAGMRGAQGQQDFDPPGSPYSASHPHGQHTALPQRVPTADEIRALYNDSLAYEAWQRHANAAHHVRPGAPVPPTPPNATTTTTLSYAPPSLSPPPRSTPYPYSYPYQHLVHRSQDSQHMLQRMQQQQLQHMQLLAGMQTDSTFSPSSTPYPSYDYSPFLPEHFRRTNGVDEPSMSLRSSPSHFPVNLPVFTPKRKLQAKRKSVRRMRGSRELASKLPPRGESTEPRETSPESSDGEDVEEGEYEFNELAAQLETGGSSENVPTERAGGGEDDEWVDDDEDGEDDLLHLEYHPNFVVNPDKRRKRWELKWDALVKAFQALDRQTDSTLLLLASPNHGKSMYSIRSRSLRRIPSLAKSSELSTIKSSFHTLSVQRQAARAQTRHMSLAERFEHYASSTSSEGSESREEELKGALGAALSSLSALSSIYEGREQRWRTEMGRMGDERERVEVLLRQALGMGFGPGVI